MNAFSAALTMLAFATYPQEQPSPQSRPEPDTALSSYQHQGSEVSGQSGDVGAKSAAACQLKRDEIKDTATSTAFATTAAQDGMVEVALAGLALRKSLNEQVRQFAQKMVQDYAQSNGGLNSIVKCEGLILPIELDAKHIASIKRLDAKSGRAFDKAYVKHVAEKHSEAVALFESASRSGNPDLAAFAQRGLSMLQEHQLLADDLRAAVGTKVASTH